MKIGYITGSGFYDLPGFEEQTVQNRFGQVRLLRGSAGGRPTVLLPRHGAAHANLPHHINHRANLLVLKDAGVSAVVSCSVCGVELELPYVLVGFGVDYANGVRAEPTPVETLKKNLARAKTCFESLIGDLSVADGDAPAFDNFVYRF